MTKLHDVALVGSKVTWLHWQRDCLAERRAVIWGRAMAKAQAISVWHGEALEGRLRIPEPRGVDLFDPRRCVLHLSLSSELDSYPPLTFNLSLLCVREDLTDVARSIGITIHPFDRVRWFRAPLDPLKIEHGRVKWPPINKSWIAQHAEVTRGGRPLYHLGIPPDLPFKPRSRKHRYRFREETGDPSDWQFDPTFLGCNPVSAIPGVLVVTKNAPEPFLDMVADDEHFKVLPFLNSRPLLSTGVLPKPKTTSTALPKKESRTKVKTRPKPKPR